MRVQCRCRQRTYPEPCEHPAAAPCAHQLVQVSGFQLVRVLQGDQRQLMWLCPVPVIEPRQLFAASSERHAMGSAHPARERISSRASSCSHPSPGALPSNTSASMAATCTAQHTQRQHTCCCCSPEGTPSTSASLREEDTPLINDFSLRRRSFFALALTPDSSCS